MAAITLTDSKQQAHIQCDGDSNKRCSQPASRPATSSSSSSRAMMIKSDDDEVGMKEVTSTFFEICACHDSAGTGGKRR